MKYLFFILIVICSSATNLLAQNKQTWLDHTYLQVRGGLQYSTPTTLYNSVGDIGFFFNSNLLVLGVSSNIQRHLSIPIPSVGAKLHIGTYLHDPNVRNWNVLLSSGLAYHVAIKITSYRRTGVDDNGDPILDIKTKGGNSLVIPLAVELHTNKISKSGLVIKVETLIDKRFSFYFNATVGVNINTMK